MKEKKTSKYIVTKTMAMGFIRQNLSIGSIIEISADEKKMTVNGNTFTDLRDFNIASKLKDKNGESLIVPFDESNPIISKIKEQVKAKLAKQEKNAKQPMPVVMSDRDALDDIDISHTKICANKKKQKDEVAKIKESGKMIVIKDSESTTSIEKALSDQEQKVENILKRPKMKVIRDEMSETSSKTLAESAKAKSRQEPGSIVIKRKGK